MSLDSLAHLGIDIEDPNHSSFHLKLPIPRYSQQNDTQFVNSNIDHPNE